ncbi:MAG: TIGR02281 family clan AA aspartic protease [Rhodovulum sulfidophilum]|uniref:TIGR02281 family clan AA aspartic protease n=1 Tax=Rhodovulum sulfidophilum TaxID=35806 RepID=A0A2W5NB92_RHOSU|nr:MAG: TIGR02281 family clan AA aspartic protease [Rhodovulum sulfidophilum]
MSGDDLARLLYLGILLLFLLGVFGFGRRASLRGLRDVLIWVLIFLMAILAYSFRDRLRDSLFPVTTSAISEDAIELRRRPDGHFYADLEVNGAPVRFMVDTGATRIVLSRDAAEQAGLDPGALNYLSRAQTANGEIALAPVRLRRVVFGGLEARDVRANVSSGELGISLLGMDFLDRFSRIEIEGDRMLLRL